MQPIPALGTSIIATISAKKIKAFKELIGRAGSLTRMGHTEG